MRRALRAFHVGLLTLLLAGSGLQAQQHEIVLATTTSTQDTGLLDSLLPMFQQETGIAVKPIAVGTGAARVDPPACAREPALGLPADRR